MSAFYDLASLVVVPSGYKSGKVYAQKPLTTDGQLAFTRASSATRVASNGLIEKVRTNLILQSEAFNTTWTSNAAPTITANTTVAPDGTTTGDTIAASGANSGVYQVPTVASGVEHSFSVYIKNITSATSVQIGCDLGPINGNLNFNAVTGAIVSTGAGITGSSVTNAGNGWYRVSGTYVSTGASNTFVVFGNSAMTFAAWGAQFETGVTTDYIATTTAAVSVGPVSGLPRLDYLGSTCPRLLLEPQRTNVATYSEQFDNAAWSKTKATVTANDTISPDGYTNADKIVFADGTSTINQAYNLAGATATRSVYIKGTAGQTISLDDVFASQPLITLTGQWQRITFTAAAPNGYGFGISTFGGATARTIWLWGAQTEVGSYATSYIPTLGTSVTRVADAIYDESASALIGQTEGTLFVQFKANTSGNNGASRFSISSGTTANWVFVGTESNNIRGYVRANTSVIFSDSTVALTGNDKIALAYKSGSIALYINGTQVATNSDAFTFSATLDDISTGVGGSYTVDETVLVNQMLVFPTRLTNAQLAELTA
jgi:hypothetical protein